MTKKPHPLEENRPDLAENLPPPPPSFHLPPFPPPPENPPPATAGSCLFIWLGVVASVAAIFSLLGGIGLIGLGVLQPKSPALIIGLVLVVVSPFLIKFSARFRKGLDHTSPEEAR